MKKQIAIMALSVAAAYSSFAQGEVTFANGTPTKISVNTQAATSTYSAIAGAGSYYFALFSSVSSTTVSGGSTAIPGATTAGYVTGDSSWTFDAYGINSATAGRFSATGLDGAGYTQIPGQPAAAQFVVIAWSANIGSTVQSLANFFAGNDGGITTGFVGQSAVSGTISTGTAGTLNSPPPLFGGTFPSIPGFNMGYTVVPEPSTIALAGLGGLSLLAFRRKKA